MAHCLNFLNMKIIINAASNVNAATIPATPSISID